MKKFFEEPSIECVKLYSESIADQVSGVPGTGEGPEGWEN